MADNKYDTCSISINICEPCTECFNEKKTNLLLDHDYYINHGQYILYSVFVKKESC